jgi:hypothetical protein
MSLELGDVPFWKNSFRSGNTSNQARHDVRLETGSRASLNNSVA